MRTILLILLLPLAIIEAQPIFTDSFSSFPPDSTTGVSAWILWQGNDTRDIVGSNNLTPNGFSANRADELTAGSIIYQGEDYIKFNGSSEYYTGLTTDVFNANISDIAFLSWFVTPPSIPGFQHIFNKFRGNFDGWYTQLVSTPTTRSGFWAGAVQPSVIVSVATSTTYFLAIKCDRSGDMTLSMWSGSAVVRDTVDISSLVSDDNANIMPITIGRYAGGSSDYFAGGGHCFKFYKGTLPTDEEIVEQAFLPEGWTSDNGNVARYNWGWHLGIKLSSGNLLVGYATGDIVSDGAITLLPTGDSTRYTYTVNEWQSGNQIIFSTADDNLYHSLPDTTLPAGYLMQLVFDTWTETIYGETYVVIDNVTIQGVEQPESTITTSGKFKGNATHDKFKGW